MRWRIWCETVLFDELVEPRVVELLVRYRLDLLLAVRPWQLDSVGAVFARLRDAGVYVALWPMLDDSHGRWASVASQPAFIALVDEVLTRAPGCEEIIVDLEPAFAELERWKRWLPAARRRRDRARAALELARSWRRAAPAEATRTRYAHASAALAAASLRWQRGAGRPRRVTTAVMPMVPFDSDRQWLQRALGIPADGLPVQRHSVMAYTSLFEGWSHGLVGRRRAEWLLAMCARRSRARWGELAGVSLGAVGAGAFGDEPRFRDPAELARDVAIVRAEQLSEISLFELGGVLRRPPAEAWLDALIGASA